MSGLFITYQMVDVVVGTVLFFILYSLYERIQENSISWMKVGVTTIFVGIVLFLKNIIVNYSIMIQQNIPEYSPSYLMNEIEMVSPIYLYFIVQAILLLFYVNCYFTIENFQYVEMLFGSIFLILIFGYIAPYFVNDPKMYEKSIYLATLFSIWYYMTKLITNNMMKDGNGVIHWSV